MATQMGEMFLLNPNQNGKPMSNLTDPRPKTSEHLPSIREYLKSPGMIAELGRAMPKHCDPDRMARVALTAISRTPLLAECDQASFFQCMLTLSQWGLEPDGRRAHLIPFRDNKRNVVTCQLIIDYKGLVELAYRSGVVASIHADVVCENDVFEYNLGEVIQHKIDFRHERGKPYAAYCRVRMKDGATKCEVMSSAEVESIRRRSKAGSNGPWVTDWPEMAKKSAFRRVSKWLPLSAEIRDAFVDDDDTIISSTNPPASVDREPVNTIEALTRQLEQLPSVPDTAKEPIEGAWEIYVSELAATHTLAEATNVYDRWFGPDSTVEFTPDQNTEAYKLRDARHADIGACVVGKRNSRS